MSARLERTITLLRTELRDGSVPAAVLLRKALALGLNRDFLRVAKKSLGIVTIRDRDPQTGRTIRWRWSMPTVAPMPTPTPRPLIPHRWGVYSYHTEGRYYLDLIAGYSITYRTPKSPLRKAMISAIVFHTTDPAGLLLCADRHNVER